MKKEVKFKLTISNLDCTTKSPSYHPNPSCYSWVNLATNSRPPVGFVQAIIMIRPYVPGETFDEATANYKEGISIINGLTYPMEEEEKEKAIFELGKIFLK